MLVKFFWESKRLARYPTYGRELGSANVTYLSARRQENLTLNWDQAWKNQQARAECEFQLRFKEIFVKFKNK